MDRVVTDWREPIPKPEPPSAEELKRRIDAYAGPTEAQRSRERARNAALMEQGYGATEAVMASANGVRPDLPEYNPIRYNHANAPKSVRLSNSQMAVNNRNHMNSALENSARTRLLREANQVGVTREGAQRAQSYLDVRADNQFNQGLDAQRNLMPERIARMEQDGLTQRNDREWGTKDNMHSITDSRLRSEFEQRMGKVGFETGPNGNSVYTAPSGAATGFDAPQGTEEPKPVRNPDTNEIEGYSMGGKFYPRKPGAGGSGGAGAGSYVENVLTGAGNQPQVQPEVASKLEEIRNHILQKGEGDDRFNLMNRSSRANAIKERVRELRASGYEFPRITNPEQAKNLPSGTVFLDSEGNARMVP